MSMTRPIPPALREHLAANPEYSRCSIPDENCGGVIQWHHHFRFAGSRTDDAFGIISVCKYHHDHEAAHKAQLDAVMMSRVTDADRVKYNKTIWPRV